jgi:hypothetical protein
MKTNTLKKLVAHGKYCASRSFVRREELREGVKLIYAYICDKCRWKTTEVVGSYDNKNAA